MLQTKGHTFGALWQMPVAHKKPTTAGIEALNHQEPLRSKEYCITRNPSKLRGILKVLGLFASLNEILRILKVQYAFHWPFIFFHTVLHRGLRSLRIGLRILRSWRLGNRLRGVNTHILMSQINWNPMERWWNMGTNMAKMGNKTAKSESFCRPGVVDVKLQSVGKESASRQLSPPET